jgi:hypothetical protein
MTESRGVGWLRAHGGIWLVWRWSTRTGTHEVQSDRARVPLTRSVDRLVGLGDRLYIYIYIYIYVCAKLDV